MTFACRQLEAFLTGDLAKQNLALIAKGLSSSLRNRNYSLLQAVAGGWSLRASD
jgi:hypothetical protein